MNTQSRKRIFDAVRTLRNGQGYTLAEVRLLDSAIDAALAGETHSAPGGDVSGGRTISQRGIDLIHSFESLRLTTYPDPGSKDGKPVTGGWGSTVDEHGKPFRLGFTAPKEYWDRLFQQQIGKYVEAVDRLVADAPTTQNQFDSMCSLCYNIGIGSTNPAQKGGFTRSTVLRLHKARDYKGAARAFLLWNKNDGVVMRGLTRRRMAESDLYLRIA